MNRFSKDRLFWKFDKDGIFSIKSVSKAISMHKEQSAGVNSYSLTKAVWKGVGPPGLEILAWFVVIGRINTKNQIMQFRNPAE